MTMFRLSGLITIIPATLLLTVSFFVLFTLRKVETQGLKSFGYVVVSLLWISSLLFFSIGVYTISTGRPPMICMMQQMMKAKMGGMMQCPKMQNAMKTDMSGMMQEKTDSSMMKQ